MSYNNIKNVKKLTYSLLTFSTLALSTHLHAYGTSQENDRSKASPRATADQALLDESKSNKQYNILGTALFAGKDYVSKGIRKVSKSQYSHAGILLAEDGNEENKFVLEATGSVQEALHWQYPSIRLTPWDKILKSYNGKISYKLFVFDGDRPDPSAVTKLVHKYIGQDYTKDLSKLVKALFKLNKTPTTCDQGMFCSELESQFTQELGIQVSGIASNIIPRDYESNHQDLHNATRGVTLRNGVWYTPAFMIR